MSRFSFDARPAAKGGIFKTSDMRITVLTPCLLRLEAGHFTDMPTQTVWNREFDKPKYKTLQNQNLFTSKQRKRFSASTFARKKFPISSCPTVRR